jgi:hypothetical protein
MRCTKLEGRPGYSFIFESGRYDGFSPGDVTLFLDLPGRVCEPLANYRFQNVGQLTTDFTRAALMQRFRNLSGA